MATILRSEQQTSIRLMVATTFLVISVGVFACSGVACLYCWRASRDAETFRTEAAVYVSRAHDLCMEAIKLHRQTTDPYRVRTPEN